VDTAAQPPLTAATAGRRGVALFAALALTTLIALLIGGSLASFRLSARSARLTHADAMLTAIADDALGAVLSDANGLALSELPLGQSRSVYDVTQTESHVRVHATRLRDDVLWLVADARFMGAESGRRRVNVIARWHPIAPMPVAAIMARGKIRLGGGVTFAADTSGDVDCRMTSFADVVVPPATTVSSIDSVRVVRDSSASAAATYFGTAAQIDALDRAVGVVRVRGDTTISGGTFDGVMVVDGKLFVTGPFTASGLLISRGRVDATTGVLSVTGALMAFSDPPDSSAAVDISAGTIRYSPCVLAASLRRVLPLRPVRFRSWVELF
jgi:hypothetical protein